jgi:ATP-dependent exoDNAse (exonuclease V) beta subunit
VGFPPGAGIAYQAELPLQINKGRGNDPSAPLYAEDYATTILENLNLHYVATTRPRQALFIYYEVSEEKPRAASDRPNKSRATSDAPAPSFPSTWNQLHKRLQNKTL